MYQSLIVLTLLTSPQPAATAAPVPMPVPTAKAVAPDSGVATSAPTVTPMPTSTPSQTERNTVAPGRVQDAGAIAAVLTVPSTNFKAGRAIPVSITLRNTGVYAFGLPSSPPWCLVHLVITDASGRSIEYVGTDPRVLRREVMHHEQLVPGEAKPLVWNGASTFYLSEWGAALKQGAYVIEAIPRVETSDSTVVTTIRSNAIKISVE